MQLIQSRVHGRSGHFEERAERRALAESEHATSEESVEGALITLAPVSRIAGRPVFATKRGNTQKWKRWVIMQKLKQTT